MVVTYDLARPGGVKHHAEHLATALRRAGDHVTLIGPSSVAKSDADTVTFSGIANVPANGSDNQLGIFVSPNQVAKFFAAQRFDVVHIHEPLQPALSYWSVWATRATPHVATFHAYSEDEGTALRLARRTFGRSIFPWFQRAIAVSKPAARYASAAWRDALEVIPNGVSTDVFTPLARGARRPGPFRFLFVGRLADERKGARFAIEAFRRLRAHHPDVELDMVGDVGSFQVPELPGLHVHGAVGLRELAELYRQCDAFVAPATGQESFGIVLLEAMASAKPIICSDIDGYREVVRSARAHVVPPGDAGELHTALAAVLATDRHELARDGEHNRRIATNFDWRRVAEQVRTTYVDAITAKRDDSTRF
jgi:phosphatidyl-myo-inositol alpha-mannosyltransferase